jgi:predicted nucleic acid-binding protein
LVFEEAARGDAEASRKRLEYLDGLAEVAVTDDARDLAEKLLKANALPAVALYDALHIAVCAVNGVDILLTWNCKRIANAIMLGVIEKTCSDAGYVAPRVCTPIELGGVS